MVPKPPHSHIVTLPWPRIIDGSQPGRPRAHRLLGQHHGDSYELVQQHGVCIRTAKGPEETLLRHSWRPATTIAPTRRFLDETYVHSVAWGTTKAAVMERGLVEADIPPSSRRERQIEAGSVFRFASAACTPNPMFAAFTSTAEEQRLMGEATKRLTAGTSAHGNAGEASIFLVLAHRKLKMDGTLALVMPLSLMSGDSWENSR